ncbi:hypothetical protein PFISCL1PPCAC_15316, partial [Pristionchus fissidentatus]
QTYKDFSQYIAYARCVRPPPNPSADCSCGSIPHTGPQALQTVELEPYMNKRPACPTGYNLWVYCSRQMLNPYKHRTSTHVEFSVG